MIQKSLLFFAFAVGTRDASAMFRLDEIGSNEYEFKIPSQVHDAVDTSRSLLTSDEVLNSLDICGGFALIVNQLPNGNKNCICQDNQVLCTFDGTCSADGTVCTDVISIAFQFLVGNSNQVNRMKLSACFTYQEEFEPTCIDTLIAPDQQLDTCNTATYGGKQCMCGICRDRKSLALDCSSHHPMATSNGCYRLADALPPLAKFNEPSI